MSDKSAFEISKGFAPDTIRSRGNYRRSGHGFSTGDVVYFDGTVSDWRKSDWLYYNLTGSSDALGIVDVQDAYRFDVVYRGSILLPDSMAVTGPIGTIAENTVYFLSETPGVLTETPPIVDQVDPMVRKPMIVTLNSTGSGFINSLVVNYRGYVEDTYGCVAFIQNLIPVGVIDYIPGGPKNSEDLDGWLLCDGSEYFIEEYPELYSVIGNAYGTPTEADRFRVPDLWHKDPNQSTAEFRRLMDAQYDDAAGVEGGSSFLAGGAPCPDGCIQYIAVRVYKACCQSMCGLCRPGDLCGTSASGGISCCNGVVVETGDTICIGPDALGCVSVPPKPGGFSNPSPQDQCGPMELYWVTVNPECTVVTGKRCCTDDMTVPYSVPCLNAEISDPAWNSSNCTSNCNAKCMGQFAGSIHTQSQLQCGNCGCGGNCTDSYVGDENATADALCACCGCAEGDWGCAPGGGSPQPTPQGTPSQSGDGGGGSPQPTPQRTPAGTPAGTPVSTPASTPPATPATQTPTVTPSKTPRVTPTPTPTPFPTPGTPPEFEGRIMVGKNAGATAPTDAYGGNDDIEILEQAGVIGEGVGYAHTSGNKNRQAVYHCNFYIRARSVERYVNIETCNGAGGAVRNWIPNGSFNVWQRGTSFAPDTSKTQSDHLADLNRYTADRWFRKVGFCPEGFGATGTGASAPSSYVGVCNRKSFNFIDTTIPDALQNQYPTHFMEYQSFVSGPGVDTSLEYCVLENRISDVKTLSGELVCLSFWARSNTPGSVYVNLKQHFGYDVPTSSPLTFRSTAGTGSSVPVVNGNRPKETTYSFFSDEQYAQEYGVSGTLSAGRGKASHQFPAFYMGTGTANDNEVAAGQTIYLDADSSAQGGVNAIFDGVVALPNAKQVQEILLTDIVTAQSPGLGLVQVSPPPSKYGVVVEPALPEQEVSVASHVFFKNTKTATNTKVEGRASEAEVITINDSVSVEQEADVALLITLGINCVANDSCETCTPYLQYITCLGSNIFQNETVEPCIATLAGSGSVSVPAGQTGTSITTSITISSSLYDQVQAFTRGTAAFPSAVTAQAIALGNSLIQNNPLACRCTTQSTILPPQGECVSMTVSKNFDPTETLGICCVVTVDSVQVGQSGATFVTHTRSENQTVHGCTALGGQFIPYSAVDYFAQFETTHCGVTEDQCSRFAKIEVTQQWQQFQVVFQIPSVDNRYIGNSGTDYLAVQLWTHLSNGYCRTYSGAEAPPRNRLGESYGTIECSENSLCEPCVSVYPTSFSYRGTLNLAQFQLESGTEFTGFVKPNTIEDLDYCQAFFEKNSCAGRGEYFPVSGTAFLEYHVELKKQKICTDPRPVISAFNASTVGLSGIDILADSVTPRGFAVGANVTVDDGAALLAFGYECDCDIYRPEELQYLDKQLAWKTAET